MAKISVSLDDDLADEVRKTAPHNVSAFVAEALRDALDRHRLNGALHALDEELGALDAGLLDDVGALFDEVQAANRGRVPQPAKHVVEERSRSTAAVSRPGGSMATASKPPGTGAPAVEDPAGQRSSSAGHPPAGLR